MGRKRAWTSENLEEWNALAQDPAFGSLLTLVTKGLNKVEAGDIAPLLPTALANLDEARDEIRRATSRLEPATTAAAVAALLRVDPTHENTALAIAQRMARVHLGEAEGLVPEDAPIANKIHALPTADNSAFRRRPSASRRPGEMFYMLRALYGEITTGRKTKERLTDEPHLAADVAMAVRDAEIGAADELRQVSRLIRRRYRTDLELSQLASFVVEDHQAIERLDMVVALQDYDEHSYIFHVSREFQARLDRYVVAVACGTTTHAAILSILPELRELIWLPDDTDDLDGKVNALVEEGMLQVRDERSVEGYDSVPFEPVARNDPMQARLHAQGVDDSKYRLIHYSIAADTELRHYRSVLPMQLRRARPHCSWFAEGPIYVNRIIVDISGFSDAATSEHPTVHYFLPGRTVSNQPPRFERIVHSWVVRRHGFVIRW